MSESLNNDSRSGSYRNQMQIKLNKLKGTPVMKLAIPTINIYERFKLANAAKMSNRMTEVIEFVP